MCAEDLSLTDGDGDRFWFCSSNQSVGRNTWSIALWTNCRICL